MVAVGKTTTTRSSGAAPYLCYILISTTAPRGRTYVGITNDLTRRLRQHNGELVGGARATRTGRPWECLLTVEGFGTQQQSLQFEWMWKHMATPKQQQQQQQYPRYGPKARLSKLHSLLQKERWTEKAPLAASIPLVVTVYPTLRFDSEDTRTMLLSNGGKDGLPQHVELRIRADEEDTSKQ